MGALIILLTIFSKETLSGKASHEKLLLVRDTTILLQQVIWELVLMFCFLVVALLNTFNAGSIVDESTPTPPFWIVFIVNQLLCIYGLIKNKN